jgi:transmembrane sensor
MADLPYSDKILELAGKWVDGTITESEKKEFIDWYNRFDDRELLLSCEYAPLVDRLEQEMLAGIRQRITAADDVSPPASAPAVAPAPAPAPASTPSPAPSHEKRAFLYQMPTRKIAAAVIIAVIAATAALLVTHQGHSPAPTALAQTKTPVPHDIQPGANKAVLTLADGSTISLDSAHTGNLALQGQAKVLKLQDGVLKYNAVGATDAVGAANAAGATAANTAANGHSAENYNTLATPRGGQYRLVLSDGTRVWLNAASSIRYPTTFTGTERKVEISGEAYFEIAKNAAMPFRVLAVANPANVNPSPAAANPASPMQIDVLGTHFNVNAYTDEPETRTTLLEGSIRVSKEKTTQLLKPGQATLLQKDGAMKLIPNADLEQAVAWKDGIFEFTDEELPVIMRQISRWYNIDVDYQGSVPTDRFTGRVSRNTTLSGLLKILKLSDIQLTVSENKIVVKS